MDCTARRHAHIASTAPTRLANSRFEV